MMAYVNFYVLLLSWFLIFEFVCSRRNITTTDVLRDSEIIESSNGIFKLGFFSPANSTNRYVGIWYSNEEPDRLEVAWVANRESPVTDSAGVFKISADGNLQVLDGQNKVFWSSNVSFSANNTVAQLLDTGNLVLQSRDGQTIWRSFEHPTDSFLPQMTFAIDENVSNKKVLFRSWKSPSDPSSGNFTVGINTVIPPQVFLWNNDRPNWRNSPWKGTNPIAKDSVLNIVDNEGKIYFGFSLGTQSGLQHFVVNYDGNLVQRDWNVSIRKWEIVWRALESDCDAYGKCGSFGICNSKNSPICACLEGFVPKNNEEWSKGNWNNGCVRRTSLNCETSGVTSDEFWKSSNLKVPDGVRWYYANGEDDCRRHCLGNCSCLAYSYFSSIGCMIWNESLIDVDVLHTKGLDLYVRLAYSEIGKLNQQQPAKADKRKIILIVMTAIGIAIFSVVMYCLWRRRWMCQTNGVIRVAGKVMPKGVTREVEVGDLPVFGLEKLAIATNHFQDSNKLGRGGFGIVYKGILEDEQEIAVKRLSKTSGQGLEEFMNEVLVIAKLQHRNLVKLLGCCVEGEEKMLVYEYMPNKSLDALLFDPNHQKLLDWKIRFNIILGICRGLLYLHRDSRLRIIHRDLKASNILLDGNLNPKISDFGMARIMGGNQDQADTIRIVGTYGYMSPEYALEGRFSEKSDVFSFGVLLLEILSGRRNSSFKDEEPLSLLGHAWKLWNEDNTLSLIDPTISDLTFQAEIFRCIQLGLLCVQEFSEDRPSTSMVLSMIENEISDLPRPSQPGLTQRRVASHNEAHQNGHEQFSVNRVSISNLSGR